MTNKGWYAIKPNQSNNQPTNLFTYLSNNISSTESDVNIRIAKAWTAIDRLFTVYKSSW